MSISLNKHLKRFVDIIKGGGRRREFFLRKGESRSVEVSCTSYIPHVATKHYATVFESLINCS